MKKFSFIILTLAMISTFSIVSCKNTDKKTPKLVEQTVNNRFKISVPKSFTHAEGLNNDASLQMEDKNKEFYLLVIEDSKHEFEQALANHNLEELYGKDIEGYTNMLLEAMEINAGIFDVNEMQQKTINEHNAFSTEFFNVFENLDIYYHFTTIETEKNFYQIMLWTLKANKDEYRPIMEEISKTFVEIE